MYRNRYEVGKGKFVDKKEWEKERKKYRGVRGRWGAFVFDVECFFFVGDVEPLYTSEFGGNEMVGTAVRGIMGRINA